MKKKVLFILALLCTVVQGAWAQLTYIECSWDDTNKQVVKTTKTLSNLIGYGDTPSNGDYKEVTSVNWWFQLGGFTDADEYYVVRGNVSHTTLNVLGKKVHLILCDGATLTLSGGILMYGDHRLYIHSQSYGGSMGKLVVQSGYNSDAAGIGSDYDGNSTSYQRTPADLEIHGGDIYAKGGDDAAGIGGGNYQHGGLVIIYGGKIAAHGGDGSGLAGNGGAGIVKWPTAGDPIENPVFTNVTIDNEFPIDQSVASRDGLVRFRGIYNPVSVTTWDRSMLYLDSGSTLRHPDSGTAINAFRAYFQFGEISCDVNGDGIVDIADVTALIRFVLSGDASSIVIENADVNGDGEFTISDVTILIGFVLKDDCTIHVINVEVTGADSITFGGIGNGPAR